MNRPRKRHSISTSLDYQNSKKDSPQMNNLKKLNANILNYIKLKGIKYHNLSYTPTEHDYSNDGKKKIETIKEENEDFQKTNNKSKSQEANKRNINEYLLELFVMNMTIK